MKLRHAACWSMVALSACDSSSTGKPNGGADAGSDGSTSVGSATPSERVASCDEAPDGTPCGAANEDTHCIYDACVHNACGDGIRAGDEECDDGDESDGDGCSSLCLREACGNGRVDVGEVCDDGNEDDTDQCTSLCQRPDDAGLRSDAAAPEACSLTSAELSLDVDDDPAEAAVDFALSVTAPAGATFAWTDSSEGGLEAAEGTATFTCPSFSIHTVSVFISVPDCGDFLRSAMLDCPNPFPDAGLDAASGDSGLVDAGMDAAQDASADAAVDAGPDATVDAATDAAMDSGTDAASDAAMDSGVDSGTDAASDAAMDSGMDAATDAASDAQVDANIDASVDSGADTGTGGEVCGNQQDDDSDGFVDCFDSDCSSVCPTCDECFRAQCATYIVPNLAAACFDGDATVNATTPADQPAFSTLCTAFFECVVDGIAAGECLSPSNCACGDQALTDCQSGGPTPEAVCADEAIASAPPCDGVAGDPGDDDWSCLGANLSNADYPSGYVIFATECASLNCRAACGYGP